MITKSIINKVGLEAEVLIRSKKNELVIPSDYNLPCDDFIVLGEIRAPAKDNIPDTLYAFMKEFYMFNKSLEYFNFHTDIEKGWATISPEDYTNILRKMGSKEIATCKNIYKNVDILKLTDANVLDGKILSHNVSTGLHIHFSSDIVVHNIYHVPDAYQLRNNLFVHSCQDKRFDEETKLYSLLTKNTIRSIVSSFDKNIFPKYNPENVTLKYRKPGFYEEKSWGFEYRSLPFNQLVYDNLASIVEFAFEQLSKLSKVLV